MPDDDLITLIRGLQEARVAGFPSEHIDYQRTVRAAVAGRFPAHQGPNGRWWVRRSDLAVMVEAVATLPVRQRASLRVGAAAPVLATA